MKDHELGESVVQVVADEPNDQMILLDGNDVAVHVLNQMIRAASHEYIAWVTEGLIALATEQSGYNADELRAQVISTLRAESFSVQDRDVRTIVSVLRRQVELAKAR
jgi:hypothetical protein